MTYDYLTQDTDEWDYFIKVNTNVVFINQTISNTSTFDKNDCVEDGNSSIVYTAKQEIITFASKREEDKFFNSIDGGTIYEKEIDGKIVYFSTFLKRNRSESSSEDDGGYSDVIPPHYVTFNTD